MRFTSEERREVAERLRDWADDLAESREIDFELCGCEVTGNDPYHAHVCARHIADLIDQTCIFDQLESDDVYVITCSKCGMKFNEHDDKSADIYRFCPNCGARVVQQ